MLKFGPGVFGRGGGELHVVVTGVDRRRDPQALGEVLEAVIGGGGPIPTYVAVGSDRRGPIVVPIGTTRQSTVDAAIRVRRLLHDAVDFPDAAATAAAAEPPTAYPLFEALGIDLAGP